MPKDKEQFTPRRLEEVRSVQDNESCAACGYSDSEQVSEESNNNDGTLSVENEMKRHCKRRRVLESISRSPAFRAIDFYLSMMPAEEIPLDPLPEPESFLYESKRVWEKKFRELRQSVREWISFLDALAENEGAEPDL
ncbi:unnamed protein product [Symbiodinium sp. CCMP2592]|nr:unnamed protein product [Symbiodinium sp. CCMP2592]